MSSFERTNNSYESAITSTIYTIAADPGDAATIAVAHTRLARLANSGNDDLTDTVELLRIVSYRLSYNLLPADHPALGLAVLNVELGSQVAELEPGTHAHAIVRAAHQALTSLAQRGPTELTTQAIDLLNTATENSRTVVLRHSKTASATTDYLNQNGVPSTVVAANQLRFQPPHETMVLIGPPRAFPAATCNAAKADNICFIHYPFGSAKAPTGGLFGADGGLTTRTARPSGHVETLDDIGDFELDEGLQALARDEFGRRRSERPDAVTAALLLLEGGYGVWTAIGEGHWMWCVDLDDDDTPTIRTTSVSAVTQGSYVIFRDKGAGTALVRAVADAHHQAGKYRPQQDRWKSALEQAVIKVGGVNRATVELRRLGATTVNLRHWMSENSIRPRRLSDFRAVCQFAGIAAYADDIWRALGKIHRAHVLAGQTIRRWLQDALLVDGGARLRQDGFQRVDFGDLGTLSAYRVEHQHPDHQDIDPEFIDEPFVVKEHGWHG